MFIASGIPYAPHMFEIVYNTVTLTSSTNRLAQLNMSRVGLYIQIFGFAFPAGAFFSANSTGADCIRLTPTSTLGLEMYWEKYFVLCGSEIWINDAGIGNTFSVTEVRVNQSTIGEIDNATRKPQGLKDKIKSYLLNRGSKRNDRQHG